MSVMAQPLDRKTSSAIEWFVEFDERPVWVSDVNGPDSPFLMVSRRSHKFNAFGLQIPGCFRNVRYAENDTSAVAPEAGPFPPRKRVAHFLGSKQGERHVASLEIRVATICVTECRFESEGVAIKPKTGGVLVDEESDMGD